MLSVCIPVYKVKINKLVNELQRQIIGLDIPAEIIIIDDCSGVEYSNENKALATEGIRFVQLNENVGRARIRNLFLQYVKYPSLLFLDCDSEIISDNFISEYITEIKKGSKVICGGRVYSKVLPSHNYKLHWTYGKQKESQPASQRNKNPNASFMTNNFLVDRDILAEIKLDERLRGYGHEDTLFGYQLKLNNIHVAHIDNPVLHAELQENRVFVENTESAIRNLIIIASFINDAKFIKDVKLLRTYYMLKKYGLLFFAQFFFTITSPIIRPAFCSGFANMFFFNSYKLGYLSANNKAQ